jgi:hypothetical protein
MTSLGVRGRVWNDVEFAKMLNGRRSFEDIFDEMLMTSLGEILRSKFLENFDDVIVK